MNIASPESMTDAVNKEYVDNGSPIKIDNYKSYSLHQYRLSDVARPTDDGDAVNLIYLQNNTILKNDNYYDAKGNRITNVEQPKNVNDVVSKQYVDTLVDKTERKLSLVINDINKLFNKLYDMEQLKITYNAALRKMETQYQQSLKKFGAQLFKYVNVPSGRSKSVTKDTYLNWGEIFKETVEGE